MRLDQIPFIYDIPPRSLWIAPVMAASSYLFLLILQKTFSLTPDNQPLSTYRTRVAQFYHGNIRFGHPDFYTFLHVHIKDNLPLAVFLVALYVLKESNKFLQTPAYMWFIIPPTCILLSVIRFIALKLFSGISQGLRARQFNRIAQMTSTIAVRIAPSVEPSVT